MSVILDALRRGRARVTSGSGAQPPSRGVPAALGLGAPARASDPDRRPRPGIVLLPVAVIAAGVWAALQFSSAPPSGTGPVPADAGSSELRLNTAAPRPPMPPAVPDASDRDAAPRTGTAGNTTEPARTVPDAAPPDTAPDAPPVARRSGAPARAAIPPALPAAVPGERAVASAPAPRTAADAKPTPGDFELAVRHQALGNFEQALQHYMAVLQQDAFNVEARNNLGLLYHQRGLPGEAIEQFRRALLIDPQYVRARSNLAVVLTAAGRLAEARAELRAALAVQPRSVDLLVNMALVEKADRKPDAALEVLLRALAAEPRHPVAHYNIAVLYEEKGSMALAYDHYQTFLMHAAPEHAAVVAGVQARVADLAAILGEGSLP